ncbi:methyl-accepting chemotaxis protein [Salinimonas chungwhensis]|uniref:methyl-accepting chemotaxis protein n=1 Tax=Salinimonas chungwhensis TaxID=265425 RepID=UPI000364530B|nr:methyl-accepting chemotaxis protein [Salinimonas chungwhensis]
MFVLKSSFDEKQQEIARLEAEKAALQDKVYNLETALDEERSRYSVLKKQTDADASDMLTSALMESMHQVVGIRETVANSYDVISNETHKLNDIDSLVTSSSASLKSISQAMEALNNRMGQMSERIAGLSDTADSINKFVSTITSISDQTNLLALNAAIEAARAGDAGRGFSVVADEVRALANETNKSASEVAELVKGIIQSTKAAVGAVSELQDNNSHLTSGVDDLSQDYDKMVTFCGSMKQTITVAAHQTFIQTVKLDHVAWKSEVYAVIKGDSQKHADDFADHRTCRLGQWYQQQAGKPIAQSEIFTRLDIPHAKVHRAGTEALVAMQNNDKEKAYRLIDEMEQASQETMTLLDRLAGEVMR